MRLIFLYKHNPQDPSQKALTRWLPRFVKRYTEFRFESRERQRFHEKNLVISTRLMMVIDRFKPTHIFCWLPLLNPSEVHLCKSRGIKIIFALNGFATFSTGLYRDQSLYFETLREIDIFLVPHRPHLKSLLSHGINAIELSFFYDPEIFKPLPSVFRGFRKKSNDIFFVGNFGNVCDKRAQGAYRRQAITTVGSVCNVKVMSDKEIQGDSIFRIPPTRSDMLINWYANKSQASLCFDYFPNINDYEQLNENIVQKYDVDYFYAIRPRILTMMGAGSMVFVDRHPEVERRFTDGEDVVMWDGVEELRERVLYYFKCEDKRREVAANGHRKVREFHTIGRRLEETIMPLIAS